MSVTMPETGSVDAARQSDTRYEVADRMQEIAERIRQEARRLLREEAVDVFLGYGRGWDDEVVTPVFLTDESQVDELVFNDRCTHNLAKFLVGREGYLTSRFRAKEERPRVALVALPATARTLVGLIQEHQIERHDVVVLGILDGTAIGIDPDVVVGEIDEDRTGREAILARIQELEEMSAEERREYWEKEFSRCIRCYACRQVCPFCWCEQCIVDENQPQWVGRSPSLENNTSWNIIRALHLVGRCTECGECERACPVAIPLSAINTKMALEVEAAFDYVPGTDVTVLPALNAFRVDDPDDHIK
jgi:ferredoxin